MNLEFAHWLVILSSVIAVAGAIPYILDTLKGSTKPNRVSWFMWALAPLIGVGAAVHAEADLWATVRIFLAGLLPLIVLIASFLNRRSYWKLTPFDLICGAFSVLALVFWWFAGSPQMAILLAAIGDGFALLPTFRKAWKFPETEIASTYLAGLISAILVIPSIPVWNIENAAFQIYLLLANTMLLFALYRKRLW